MLNTSFHVVFKAITTGIVCLTSMILNREQLPCFVSVPIIMLDILHTKVLLSDFFMYTLAENSNNCEKTII